MQNWDDEVWTTGEGVTPRTHGTKPFVTSTNDFGLMGIFILSFSVCGGGEVVHVSSGALRGQGMESSGAGCVLPVVGAGY